MKKTLCGISVCLLATVSLTSLAYSESLKEILETAYVSNPTLKAQQAAVRATDENIA